MADLELLFSAKDLLEIKPIYGCERPKYNVAIALAVSYSKSSFTGPKLNPRLMIVHPCCNSRTVSVVIELSGDIPSHTANEFKSHCEAVPHTPSPHHTLLSPTSPPSTSISLSLHSYKLTHWTNSITTADTLRAILIQFMLRGARSNTISTKLEEATWSK